MIKRIIIWAIFIAVSVGLLAKDIYTSYTFQRAAEGKEMLILGNVKKENKLAGEAQECLKRAGLKPGPADGIIGWQTRDAIKRFQKRNDLKASGYIDEATWSKLKEEADKTLKTVPAVQADIKTVSEKPSFDKNEDKSLYIFSKSRTTSSRDIYNIQRALKKAGFKPGPIDGKLGKRTTAAVRYFQKAKGLRADGVIGEKTWQELCNYF